MKRVLIIISLLFFIPTIAQKQEAILYLKDGSELKGLAKIEDHKIKFRLNKGKKKQWYDHQNVIKLKIKDYDYKNMTLFQLKPKIEKEFSEYQYKVSNGYYKKIKLLQLYKKGKITLYRELKGFADGTNRALYIFYVGKNNNDIVTSLDVKFKKTAINFFKDCPELVQKINNKEYQKKNVVEVIEFYNMNCD